MPASAKPDDTQSDVPPAFSVRRYRPDEDRSEVQRLLKDGLMPGRVEYEPRIYDASTSRLLEVIRESEDAADRLLLVGHNPGLENLVLRLAGDDHSDLCDRIVDGFPTAAIAAVELPADSWSDVSERSGKIVELILPKELD